MTLDRAALAVVVLYVPSVVWYLQTLGILGSNSHTTNAFQVAPEELGGLLSSEIVSKAFVGARLVKAFNHLPAAQLGTNPPVEGQRQAVFS